MSSLVQIFSRTKLRVMQFDHRAWLWSLVLHMPRQFAGIWHLASGISYEGRTAPSTSFLVIARERLNVRKGHSKTEDVGLHVPC